MSRIGYFFLTIALSFTLFSCGERTKGKAGKSEALLNEAEFFVTTREFKTAEEKIEEALELTRVIIKAEPKNYDYLLLNARANVLLFQAKNVMIIENAPEQPRSLVQIPDITEYRDYAINIGKAEEILKEILNQREQLTREQEIGAHNLLGAVYRLTLGTLSKADIQHRKALSIYRKWLRELNREKPNIGSHNFKKEEIKQNMKVLQMGRVEINLLQEKWESALSLLEDLLGGKDLKYFSVQFTLFENKITALLNRYDESKAYTKETREGELLKLVKRARNNNEGAYEYTPLEQEIITTEQKLTEAKNNMMYRIICYYNMEQEKELSEARAILQAYYPEFETRLFNSLQQSETKEQK